MRVMGERNKFPFSAFPRVRRYPPTETTRTTGEQFSTNSRFRAISAAVVPYFLTFFISFKIKCTSSSTVARGFSCSGASITFAYG